MHNKKSKVCIVKYLDDAFPVQQDSK